MDFKQQMTALSQKINGYKEKLQTEEAVKTAIVLPFIQALGYDIFDPSVVNPEYTADVGIKKGEKVDYAIMENGNPIFIIECKHWKQKITAHGSQLFRYFNVTPCKFALLTNGIELCFYSDFDSPNIMDDKPFYQCDLSKLDAGQLDFIEWFHVEYFDKNKVLEASKKLKYQNEFTQYIKEQSANPNEAYIRFVISQVYKGKMTDKVIRELTPIVLSCILPPQ
jgi:predicted type IV restriction endonuclease